ncbi:hypothetical protein [Aurantiacibacter suaedae]|uniref:hypothetical protein n=1 Tax=Aurantiacibacter suaedae TaxID=2545755 RepID=UPI0010F794E9|nr:hypothetical protein [Aurantiacibacter suaedae]
MAIRVAREGRVLRKAEQKKSALTTDCRFSLSLHRARKAAADLINRAAPLLLGARTGGHDQQS